jgi:large subunit ribosomal protein L23
MDPYKTIIRPLITEKGTGLNEGLNQYLFEVNPDANKLQVAEAVKAIYGVRVVNVRTLNQRGKMRRYRFKTGRTRTKKKAVVTLHEEDRIDLF